MTRRRLGQRGGSALEFALVTPALVLIALGAIELGLQGTIKTALEIGARNASRVGITGATGSNDSGTVASDAARQSAIRQLVTESRKMWLDDANLTITQTSFAKIADLPSAANPDGINGVTGPGGSRRLVSYKLTYVSPSFNTNLSGLLITLFGSSPIPTAYVHTSTIVVTNEPF